MVTGLIKNKSIKKIQRPALLIAGLFFVSCSGSDKGEISDFPDTTALTRDWEKAVPFQEIPDGLISLKSEDCGQCHVSHYQEWQTSTHAQAWKDPQFQKEIQKESSPYLCINCHAPLENQQSYLISGLLDGDVHRPVKQINPRFDADLRDEGINCVSCHVRDGFIIGTQGTGRAPHPVKKDPDFLSEQLCLGCHNAVEQVAPDLVCSFETGNEWMNSSHKSEGKNCISCHLKDTIRPLITGGEPRLSHFHFFPGSGIPKFAQQDVRMLNGLSYILSDVPQKLKKSDSIKVSLTLVNDQAGHRVPTGDPERYLIVSFDLKHANGQTAHHEEFRIGEKWEWYPEAKKLSDNNIEPGTERTFNLSFLFKTSGEYELIVQVTKFRMSPEMQDYHELGEEYPIMRTVYAEKFQIRVTDN